MTNYVDVEFNNLNVIGVNAITINCNLFFLFVFKIVKIDFKMKLQSYFCLDFFQMPTKHGFLYLSLHLSKWNESKLLMLIKIYTIKYNLPIVFFEKMI